MRAFAAQYSIARFVPLAETEEFANFAVVVFSPSSGRLTFRITKKRTRITQFFHRLDPKIFLVARRALGAELKRVKEALDSSASRGPVATHLGILGESYFKELIRPREGVVRFSPPRSVLAEDLEEVADRLLEYYVEHSFITPVYQERLMEQQVRQALHLVGLQEKFRARQLGDETYHARFPFVHGEGPVARSVIKPLDLSSGDSTRILDHGGAWLFRIAELRRRQRFASEALVVIGARPQEEDRAEAYEDLRDRFLSSGIAVTAGSNTQAVVDFAKAS